MPAAQVVNLVTAFWYVRQYVHSQKAVTANLTRYSLLLFGYVQRPYAANLEGYQILRFDFVLRYYCCLKPKRSNCRDCLLPLHVSVITTQSQKAVTARFTS